MNATTHTKASQDFRAWRDASETAATLRAQMMGRRVQLVGFLDGAPVGGGGVVLRVTAAGLTVRWDRLGNVEVCHPDDLVFI